MTVGRDLSPEIRNAALETAESLSAKLRQVEKALQTMQVGVTITDLDRVIQYTNPAEAEMHGFSVEELIGQNVDIFAPPNLLKPMARNQLKEVRTWSRESVNVRKDGSLFPVEMHSDVVLDDEGEPVAVVSICQDITDRRTAEEALRESEERYALALAGSNDGLWDWDQKAGRIFFSARWKAMLGCRERAIGDSPDDWFDRVHPEDIDKLKQDIADHLEGATSHFENEHRMLHADETYRWMLSRGLAVRNASGTAYRMAGSQTDITDRKVRDPLTGLPNRALFLDRLDGALARARRHGEPHLAVLFLDLDRFKVVNDSLGHLVGDQLLVAVAHILESCVRPGDTVARLGGDEFTILVEDMDSDHDALRVAQRILDRLANRVEVSGHQVYPAVSIGIVVYDPRYQEPEEMLRDADTAMYGAKAQGGARHMVFDSIMRQVALDRLRIETELREALERNELTVYYQPIVSLVTGRIVGLEALVRWLHPTRGVLLPDLFIPIAEETGMIVELGLWVLHEACVHLEAWRRAFSGAENLTISVNMSPRQLSQPDIVEQIRNELERADFEAECLAIEITESSFVSEGDTISKLEEIRALGVQVRIDDFGTGYSSLSYLQRLPIDGLKIDRSFITKLASEPTMAEMVRTVIQLADELGLDVTAEGVETGTEMHTLKAMRCGYMQGFSFSRPLEHDSVLPFLRRKGAICFDNSSE